MQRVPCPACGNLLSPSSRWCGTCGYGAPGQRDSSALITQAAGPPPAQNSRPGDRREDLPPVLTRTYHGKPNEVETQRAADAEVLARSWYFPTSQSYVEGRWSGGAWVLAFLAMVFLIGIIILAYMIAAKPAGTLTVIYERRLPMPAVAAPAATAPTPPAITPAASTAGVASEMKVCPECAEEVRAAARICRYCRHEFASAPAPEV